MARIQPVDPEKTTGKTREILGAVEKLLGVTPNLFKTAARAPSVLEGMFGLSGATSKGSLGAAAREAIALTVAEANRCNYCLSAHTVLGKGAGLSDEDIARARDGAAADPKLHAILRFARAVVAEHGRVSEDDVAALRRAGVSDAEALEIVANVVLNVMTNYVNLVAQTEIDFPVVRAH